MAPSESQRADLQGRPTLSTLVVVVGILAPAVNTFITATVLPSVVKEIGGLPLYAWATTAYAVTSIVGSAASSVAMRRLGTRIALVGACVILVTGTAACGGAPTMGIVVTGRAIQGIGSGLMIGIVHGMIRELFPEPMWPRLLATVSAAWGVAALSGPFAGGLLAQIGMWRTAFWAMVPLIVAPAVMAWSILPRRPARVGRPERVPFGRLLLLCTAVLCIASVANAASGALRATLVTGAAVAIGWVIRLDARAKIRLFPSEMLSLRRPMGKAFAMIFLIAMAASPTGIFMPLLVQILHGVPPAVAGYFYAAQSLAWTTAALVTARLAIHHVRAAFVTGPLMVSAGLAGLFFMIGPGPVLAIAACIALVGAGIGTCWAHIGNVVLASARKEEGAISAAMIPSAQLFAMAFGAAISGIIASAAGLSHSATPPVAALTGTTLFGGFALAPLAAAIIAMGLHPTTRVVREAAPR